MFFPTALRVPHPLVLALVDRTGRGARDKDGSQHLALAVVPEEALSVAGEPPPQPPEEEGEKPLALFQFSLQVPSFPSLPETAR